MTKLSSTPVRLAHIVIRPLSREDNVQKIALRFSRHITQLHDTEAIIYVIASEISANASETNPLTVHLPELPSWILASLPKSEQRRERHRISYLVLKEAIARAVDQRPSITQHIIVSVDAESTGALCQQVADAMHLTHVTYIKSPEPDEQAHVSSLSHYSQYVLRAADWIVTDAQSQLLALENGLKLRNLTSINDPDRQLLSAHTRKPGCKSSALLFSDIGYSTAAGTLTLFRAFENLRKKGLDVRLTVCGHTEMGESELWSEEKAIQKQRHGNRLALEGFLQRHDVQRLLAQSHIYCIPRRHDDSEDGSVQALLSGIPVVGPEIAEMSELDAKNAPHLSLSEPGDDEDFTRKLEGVVVRTLANGVSIDGSFPSTISDHPQPRHRKNAWEQVLASAFANHLKAIQGSRKRVLLFCHDGRGLGHLRRLSRIAEALQGPLSALVVTGNREASWIVPENAEYVHLPGLASILASKAAYWNMRPFADFRSEAAALAFRQPLITTTAKAFDPDLLILDYLPLGKDWEMYETLRSSRARKYLVLRGVLDKPENVRRDILQGEPGRFIDSVFDRILVASDPKIIDVAKEYGFSQTQAEKLTYVGYTLPTTTDEIREEFRAERGLGSGQHWVVCSPGSGMYAEKIALECIKIARNFPETLFDIALGPKTSLEFRVVQADIAHDQNIRVMRENRQLPLFSAAADILVCHGGYNSIMEAMSGGASIVVSPTTDKDDEQYVHPSRLSRFYPIRIADELSDLREMVSAALGAHTPGSRNPISSIISTDGLSTIRSIVFSDLRVESAVDAQGPIDGAR